MTALRLTEGGVEKVGVAEAVVQMRGRGVGLIPIGTRLSEFLEPPQN
jgi:hypothetical protein